MIYLRSLLFSIGSILSTIVVGGLGTFTFPFPFRIRYGVITQWARFNLWWLRITCNVSYQVEGQENIQAHLQHGNGIIFCKHQSTWETLALQRIFPPQVWILKRELLWVPLFGWALAVLRPVAIDRSAGRRAVNQIIEQGTQRLKDGLWVVVFPEGTRVAPGVRKKFGVGGAVLAEASRYPVVPVAHNAGEFWPRKGFLKHPGTITIRVGPRIDTHGKSVEQINREAEAWIETAMQDISAKPPQQ